MRVLVRRTDCSRWAAARAATNSAPSPSFLETPMSNPLRHCMTQETAEIVDRLLGDFLLSCVGKNDLAVVNAMLSSAAIMLVAHCQRSGQDYRELVNEARNIFDLATKIAGDLRP